MKGLVLAAVVVLAAGTARAAGDDAALKQAAERIRSSDESYIVKDADGKLRKASREAALAGVYQSLAALEYKEAGSSADVDRLKAARPFSDAEAVAIDPAQLEKTSGMSCSLFGCIYIPTVVTSVRGGRKLNDDAEKEINRLQASLQEVGRSLGSDPAKAHVEAGRVYEKMAAAAKSASGKADEAPAAPAVPEFSAKRIYQQAGPAVVLLICGGKDGQGELGTGSVIDEKGRVLTNAHVVIRGSTGQPYETVKVYLKPARVSGDPKTDLTHPYMARVVKYDRELDLALLEPEGLPKIAPIALGDSERVEAGEPVAAIGHPEQGGLWTLTTGIVSTVVADLGGVKGKDVFQTDASINRGNSGGPLLDRSGAQIGVNTSMARKAADGLTITSVNFSVKSSVVKRWLETEAPALVAQLPAPAAPAPPAAPSAAPAPAPAPSAPAAPAKAKPASKPAIVTPAKPYKIEDVIEREIAEMEDLEQEMRNEVESRRGSLNKGR